MRNVINLALFTALALSSSLGAFAHGGEDDEHPPVINQQYAPTGGYPVVAPGAYAGQQPIYSGQPGHINDPLYNPGHNNSGRHKVQDALNPALQNGAPGYGVPAVAPPYSGYPGGAYPATGAGHINDPNYNPGHNNSLGHKLQDAINPAGTVPAYGVPGVAPGYGYQGAPVGANHVNSPYINPGHDGSIQHQMNDAVNGNQQILPGHIPVSNYGQQGYGSNYGKRKQGQGHGHGNGHGHSH